MTDIPRYRNGYVDDGSLIQASNRRDRCPNCNSSDYRETVSREHCGSCGLTFDYWGKGGNDVYEAMQERQREEEEQWRRDAEERWRRGHDGGPEEYC